MGEPVTLEDIYRTRQLKTTETQRTQSFLLGQLSESDPITAAC